MIKLEKLWEKQRIMNNDFLNVNKMSKRYYMSVSEVQNKTSCQQKDEHDANRRLL